jgi:hypothetical protein
VRLPSCLTRRIFAAVWHHADRMPDFAIGERRNGTRYLHCWYVIPHNRFFNIYLHHFFRSDEDRALYDHPWVNVSVILRGEYLEHIRDGRIEHRRAGDIVFRWPRTAHRIQLLSGGPTDGFSPAPAREAWSLFITGPRVRESANSGDSHCAR